MRRLFASLCLMTSLVVFSAGCGGEDPEVTKNDPIIVEIININKENLKIAEAAKKDPAKVDLNKMMENAGKFMDKMAAFEKLPKATQDKLIAKHKSDWDAIQKAAKENKGK